MEKTKIDIVKSIGTIDRCFSELLVMCRNKELYDESDRQTLKHHAKDCIAVGNEALRLLEEISLRGTSLKEAYEQAVKDGRVR